MPILILRILSRLIPSLKKLFLFDSIGAFLTAFCLGVVLANFEEVFGMPKHVLNYLSFIAICYGIYSIFCYFFINHNYRPFLRIIIVANFVYAIITVGLVCYFYQRLTIWGILYFVLEIIVMIIVILIESMFLKKIPENH